MNEKASPKHSPLPWKISRFSSTQGEHPAITSGSYDRVGNYASFDTIAIFEKNGRLTLEQWHTNAKLIVAAVNSHEMVKDTFTVILNFDAGKDVEVVKGGGYIKIPLGLWRLFVEDARKFQEMDKETK